MIIFKRIILGIFKYECKLFLSISKPKVVFVCGNIGKSTTIELIKAALTDKYKIGATNHSKNSKLDITSTVLGLKIMKRFYFLYPYYLLVGFLHAIFSKNENKILLIEIQIKYPGDADFYASFVKPDILLFTFIPENPEFFSNFSSTKEFEHEHFKIFDSIKPGGTLIYLKKDNIKAYLKENRRQDISYLSCGETDSDLIYSDCSCKLDIEKCVATVSAKFNLNGSTGIFNIKALGLHLPSLMALVVALANNLGVKVFSFSDLFHDYKPIPHRVNPLKGNNKTIVIDDTYGNSFYSTINAIETINCIKFEKNTFIILGELKNLGKFMYTVSCCMIYPKF